MGWVPQWLIFFTPQESLKGSLLLAHRDCGGEKSSCKPVWNARAKSREWVWPSWCLRGQRMPRLGLWGSNTLLVSRAQEVCGVSLYKVPDVWESAGEWWKPRGFQPPNIKMDSGSITQMNIGREQGINIPNSGSPVSCLCLPPWTYPEARWWVILGDVVSWVMSVFGDQSRAKESGEWNQAANAE